MFFLPLESSARIDREIRMPFFFFVKFFKGISPFCGAIDTPVLDF